jgi:NADPH:quinone reductase-like Zn-dependent oxidoreductase
MNSSQMKAAVCTMYGSPDVLQLKEVKKPAPRDNEVLIRVHATSVNYGDIIARNFKEVSPRKFNMPFLLWLFTKMYFAIGGPKIKILGSEFAGEIESTGKNVRSFKPGDAVFGYLGQNMGAYAEYLCIPEKGCLTTKPANMTHDEAAVVPYGSIMALNLLGKMDIRPGQKVLINGASGGIGSAAIQLAKHFGAHVTGVCGTPRLAYVKSLGADTVIDYSTEDFCRNGESYDLIFDVLGKASFSRCKKSLKKNGRYLCASFKTGKLLQMVWTSLIGGQRVICAIAPGSREDLIAVKGLVEAGKIKAAIDRRFPLEQAAEAHRYVEAGRARGKVVITVGHEARSGKSGELK